MIENWRKQKLYDPLEFVASLVGSMTGSASLGGG